MAAPETVTCSTCELHAEAVFRVEGMDCNEEVIILERRLKLLAGLEALSADLIGQRLHVKYDAAKLTTSAIVDAVGQTGMRMWLEHEEPVAYGADVARRWRLVVACALAIGAGLTADVAGIAVAPAVLFVLATILGAVSPVQRAMTAIRSRAVDINVLMVIAVAGAMALGEWLEGASVVFLFAVAQWLEVRTMERARQAIHALIDLSPREAIVRRVAGEQRVPVEEVKIGEDIVLRPGDKVPLDGVVLEGHSDVNEAPLTGESLPIDKTAGDEVYAGTINGHGALEVRVTRLVRDTRLSRIIHLVETAQASRAPVQSFVDRFARWYTPVVIVLALGIALVPVVSATADAATWVYRSLVLLVIACPCALVISTPVSVVAALSAAARNGVLIKGGAYLERLAAVRVVAFDKTGTLTKGELQVSDVAAIGPVCARDVLRFAAAVESRSEHPIARAIVRRAAPEGLDALRVTAFRSIPGLGAEADVAGHRVIVGSARMLAERQAAPATDLNSLFPALSGRGDSIVFVVIDGTLAGAIALADRPRQTARETVGLLREQGIHHVTMLTGDHGDAARAVAEHVGVDAHHATLTPDQKHTRVRELREKHGPVLMVGDGVNDAPALAAADVGVAMGAAGSDAALETADVALMSDELLKLPYALRLARATLRNIKTNVTISLALKAAFLVMAVTGSATLWMAVLADTGASVIVVGNALRLLRAR
jgi:Cd2+/Zn2+-exporting ATPase